jgi:hypothetical protein
MGNKSRYQIVNHGPQNCQEWAGQGTAFTRFKHVETGCGYTALEAYEDAVETIYQVEGSRADKLRLPKRPRGIRSSDRIPEQLDFEECEDEEGNVEVVEVPFEDVYWYLSILYTLEEG